jgi:hypothetical protein
MQKLRNCASSAFQNGPRRQLIFERLTRMPHRMGGFLVSSSRPSDGIGRLEYETPVRPHGFQKALLGISQGCIHFF